MIDQVERIAALKALAALHESGALTDEEFSGEKERLLADAEPSPPTTFSPPSPWSGAGTTRPTSSGTSNLTSRTAEASQWLGDPRRRRLLLAIGAVVVVVALGIAGASRNPDESNASVRSRDQTAAAITAASAEEAPGRQGDPAVTTDRAVRPTAAPVTSPPVAEVPLMPPVVCMNLQDAQDLIQEHGVWLSLSEDATGQGRNQIIDSNWIVVDQTPAPGTPFGEGDAVLAVVKLDEPNPC